MLRTTLSIRKALIVAMILTIAAGFLVPMNALSSSPEVFINEIQVSTSGTDWEFFELQGTPGTDLSDLTLLVIESDNISSAGTIDQVISLAGQTIPADGFWLGISPSGVAAYGVAGDLAIGDNSFENSTATYFLVSEFTGAQGEDLDADNDGVLDATPWVAILDAINLRDSATDFDYGAPSVGPDGSFLPSGTYRCPDAPVGSFGSIHNFSTPDGSPGVSNLIQCGLVEVYINEIRIDQSSTDNDEYFELAGTPDALLDGLTYIVIGDGTGGSGVVENVTDLSGQSMASSGFFVAAEITFTLGTADLTTNLNFENSDNVTHLLVRDFTGSNGQDLDTDDDGTLDITPWGEVVDCVGLVETHGSGDHLYCDTQVGPDGSFVPGQVYLCEDGWRIGEFSNFTTDTPGNENDCAVVSPGDCGDPATFIHVIQGNSTSSSEQGNIHVIEGVVVGDFQDVSTGLKGFFVQEEDADADADPTTSEGIFVFDNGFGVDVNMGDLVRVMGTVTEYFDLTELTGISHVDICLSGGTASAVTVNLPVLSLDVWEQYEGMSINLPQTLYVTDNYNVGRYGEVDLSVDSRLYAPTNIVAPGASAIALQDLNDRSRIQLDDGSTVQNPDPVPYLGLDNTLRAGDSIPGLSGVLSYSFGNYEVHPTDAVVFTRDNSRDSIPLDVGGTLKVASFNVLNYFTTLDDGSPSCGPTGGLDCRGADTPEEFTRQRDKIISAMATMDADVIGLMEIENHPDDDAVQDLVSGLNSIAGPGTYDYLPTGPIGADAIKVAFIYKPGEVAPVGPYAILDSSVDPTFLDTKNRPALAQTFQQNANGGKFTAVVNHLKSKGSPCDDVGDPDTGDGQGNCNLTRTSAAIALVNWLATNPTGSGNSNFLIIGDLNAYAMEDPITAIKSAAYSDLIEQLVANPYSYVYYGQAGYLNHALASTNLTPQVTGVTVWHINADEPSALDYNDYNQSYLYNPDQYRSSDHDPVIIGLSLCDEIAPTLEVSVTPNRLWPPNHKYVKVKATVVATDNSDPNPIVTLVSVTSNEPDNGKGDGNTVNDIVIKDDFTFKLRAERSGKGTGRVYTITYMATDDCGNSAIDQATVTVPHDKGKKKKLKKDKKHKKK